MNYPKMLYKGNQEKYQTAIADDEDHESELIEQGWCEYQDLEEAQPNLAYGVIGSASGNGVIESLENQIDFLKGELIDTENKNTALSDKISKLDSAFTDIAGDLEAANLKNVELYKKIGGEQKAHFDFQNNIDAMKAQIDRLQGGDAVDKSTTSPVDYSTLTTAQLQEMLAAKGIVFKVRDTKAELIELLEGK